MKFCPECGAKLVSQKFCAECGADLRKYFEDTNNGSSLGNFDFSTLEQEAQKQLAEQERLKDFRIENGVLVKYKGKGGKVVVPKEVTIIGEEAFEKNETVTEVVLPEGITEIAAGAFSDAKALQKINFPKSLKTIGIYAFGYAALEEAIIPEGAQVLRRAFWGCRNLKRVSLPNTLTVIAEETFGCTEKLLALFIPASVKKLESGIFYDSNIVDLFFEADSLPRDVAQRPEHLICGAWNDDCNVAVHFSCRRDQVVIPDYDAEARAYGSSLENYNKDDFEVHSGSRAECRREMSSVRFPYGVTCVPSMENVRNAAIIELPKTTTLIKDSIVPWNEKQNTTLKTVYAEGLVRIEYHAFQNCTALTSFYNTDSLQVIGDSAFAGCTNLTRFTFPKVIQEMGSSAFRGVPALKNIKISGTLDVIPSAAFKDCPNLESVEIGEGIAKIKSHAFCGCKKLRKVTIPGTVEKIEDYAFSGCENLETVELGEGIREIGSATFRDCKKLKAIKIPHSVVSMCTDWGRSFDDCDGLQFVYIPYGRKNAFEKAFPYYNSHLTFIEY